MIARLVAKAPAEFGTYVEPFAGSLSLFLALRPETAVLGDLNAELMLCYRQVRRRPNAIALLLKSWRPSRRRFTRLRDADPRDLDAAARAARFIYLNRYCFNGLYRTNREGQFNVPYAPARSGPLPGPHELQAFARSLRRAALVTGDFSRTLSAAPMGESFFYLDPPYAVKNRRVFRQYDAHSFSLADLTRLRAALSRIDRAGGKFIVSYAYCSEAIEAFQHWHIEHIMAKRHIAGFASKRRKAREILVSNY